MSAPVLPPKEGTQRPRESESFKLQSCDVPEYLDSLPIKNLKELVMDHELLKDYLLMKNEIQTEEFRIKVKKQLDNNVEILNELLKQYDDEIVPRQEAINTRITLLKTKFQQNWAKLELEMFQLLNKYSHDNLETKLSQLILQIDEKSHLMYQELLKADKVTDADLTSFIGEYQSSRQLYHLRKEKAYRLKENRVSG